MEYMKIETNYKGMSSERVVTCFSYPAYKVIQRETTRTWRGIYLSAEGGVSQPKAGLLISGLDK